VDSFSHETPACCTSHRKPAAANVFVKSNTNGAPDGGANPGLSTQVNPGSPVSPTAIALGATVSPSTVCTVSGAPGKVRVLAPAFWQPTLEWGIIAHVHFPLGVA